MFVATTTFNATSARGLEDLPLRRAAELAVEWENMERCALRALQRVHDVADLANARHKDQNCIPSVRTRPVCDRNATHKKKADTVHV